MSQEKYKKPEEIPPGIEKEFYYRTVVVGIYILIYNLAQCKIKTLNF